MIYVAFRYWGKVVQKITTKNMTDGIAINERFSAKIQKRSFGSGRRMPIAMKLTTV